MKQTLRILKKELRFNGLDEEILDTIEDIWWKNYCVDRQMSKRPPIQHRLQFQKQV